MVLKALPVRKQVFSRYLNADMVSKCNRPIIANTYTPVSTRKVDCLVANAVTGLGTTVTKIASDLRHLAFMKEVGEPREAGQIGSSAMAYKQNPMRSKRIASLARVLQGKAAYLQQHPFRSVDGEVIGRFRLRK
ncbi:hypothetical protein IL306_007763 [Fusarium sp. DS 682]|nr:hypothetical protein IL306_007763 [Fusarium sp. DS 682]